MKLKQKWSFKTKNIFLGFFLVLAFASSVVAAIIKRALIIDGAPELFARFQAGISIFDWYNDPRLSAKIIYVIPNFIQLLLSDKDYIIPLVTSLTSWISQLYIYIPLIFCLIYLKRKKKFDFVYLLAAGFGLASLPASVFTANQVGHVLILFWCLLVIFSFGELKKVQEIAFSIILVIFLNFSHEIAAIFFIQLALLCLYRHLQESREVQQSFYMRFRWLIWLGVFLVSSAWVIAKSFIFEYGTKSYFWKGIPLVLEMFPGHFLFVLALALALFKGSSSKTSFWGFLGVLIFAIHWIFIPGQFFFAPDLRLVASICGLGIGGIWILYLVFKKHFEFGEAFKTLCLISLMTGVLLDFGISSYWNRTVKNLMEINRMPNGKECLEYEDLIRYHEIPSEDPLHISFLAILLEGQREISRVLIGDGALKERSVTSSGECFVFNETKILPNGSPLRGGKFFRWKEN